MFQPSWVRDKLLRLDSDDIDIALNDTTGRDMAEYINQYLAIQVYLCVCLCLVYSTTWYIFFSKFIRLQGENGVRIGVILAHPDQVKQIF